MPVSSVVRGIPATVRQIVIYTVLTVISTLALAVSPLTSWTMIIVLTIVCARWLFVVAQGMTAKDPAVWARREFRFALVFLVVFCMMIAVNPYLP